MSGIINKSKQEQNKKEPAEKKALSPEAAALRDKAVLLGWVAGILLLISLLWILTTPLQTHYLLRTVNSVFVNRGDSRRVIAHLNIRPAKANLLGYWFSMMGSTDKMFVFTVFQDGILIPLGAIVRQDGKVSEVYPLSAHAVQIFDKLPESILHIYIRRIENSIQGGYR